MVDFQCGTSYTVKDLQKLIALLRSPTGCPWDREQTHESIRRNLLEEAYETCEAIDTQNPELLREELGDMLTQVLFHAQIEEEAGRFTIDDVADATCKKLIFRHPHIFGDRAAENAEQVMESWDELKRQEKQHTTVAQSMEAVAKSLPANWRAEKVQGKAQKVGFDFPGAKDALDKLQEECDELNTAMSTGTGIVEEAGDILFAAINVLRLLGVDPEDALHASTDKFIRRFAYLEQAAGDKGQALEDLTLDEMEHLYQEGKHKRL
ncbi:MAG: nucleoside triphosphate pyrophosphohydrolase [Oscillospiraceae bacterium]|nr:nucleoside triphosphate pyrophosphohydrolase [Oscillospiraceae bacterium]